MIKKETKQYTWWKTWSVNPTIEEELTEGMGCQLKNQCGGIKAIDESSYEITNPVTDLVFVCGCKSEIEAFS